jgi:hypothetical protein
MLATWLALSAASAATPQTPPKSDDLCAGAPPAQAVTTLPQPLAKWGSLICTPYGYIISNHEEWIWSNPGSYAPVFVPAQMVRTNPAALGKTSYFTKIDMAKVSGDEFKTAYDAYHSHYAPDPQLPAGYRLDVQSISGGTLTLYFFDYGANAWGIWCPDGKCVPESKFMLIDMSKKPAQ